MHNEEPTSGLRAPLNLHEPTLIWAVGVLQPASVSEIAVFLSIITNFSDINVIHAATETQLQALDERGLVRVVFKKHGWFSLTPLGDQILEKKLRWSRDRTRLFLMKQAHRNRIAAARSVSAQDRGGVAPSSNKQISVTQEGPSPAEAGGATRVPASFRWTRVFKQINFGSGSASTLLASSFEPAENPLSYYSFGVPHRSNRSHPFPTSTNELALAIGISPKLLSAIAHKPEKYYSRFEIDKTNGGKRQISAPRSFLKTIHRWLVDYVFHCLPVHRSCFAFQSDVSIQDGAGVHAGMKWVGSLDIADFFGTITAKCVAGLLIRHGFSDQFSRACAKLITLEGKLPQGAPTSPVISNAILFEVDEALSAFVDRTGCHYTRYADDLTFSGNDRRAVIHCMERAAHLLEAGGFTINAGKWRVVSNKARQIVTGLVVNEIVQPPREQRRRIRQLLHLYQTGRINDEKEIERLRGWLSYMRSFPHLRGKFPTI